MPAVKCYFGNNLNLNLQKKTILARFAYQQKKTQKQIPSVRLAENFTHHIKAPFLKETQPFIMRPEPDSHTKGIRSQSWDESTGNSTYG
jgi:hypothetical protein